MGDFKRMRFIQCFDCKKVMWRKPLPIPRDHLVQHKCVGGASTTRVIGKKGNACEIAHRRSEKNPNGACVVVISKEQYLKCPNDGKYAEMLKLKCKPGQIRELKSRYPVKRRPGVKVNKNHLTKLKDRTKKRKMKSPKVCGVAKKISRTGEKSNTKLQEKVCSSLKSISLVSELMSCKKAGSAASVADRIVKSDIDEAVSNDEILVYPKQKIGRGAVTLTFNDIGKLKPGNSLSDNLLDFYLSYLYWEKWDESLRKRVHIFNTFFFKKWIACKQRKGEGTLGFNLSRYSVVRKWTRNVDIFTMDFLVIPVIYNLHWSLAIVCSPGAILEKSMKPKCCILGFDSSTEFHDSHFVEIKAYLDMAWSERAKNSLRLLPFSVDKQCLCISKETPSQANGADSGLFVLHNCEKFFDGERFPGRVPSGKSWYPASDISHKRKQVLQIISTKSGRNLDSFL